MTDSELNALFATKVAGWVHLEASHTFEHGAKARIDSWVDPTGIFLELPSFVNSADAVMPFVHTFDMDVAHDKGRWLMRVKAAPTTLWDADECSFALAAVLAILRHNEEIEPFNGPADQCPPKLRQPSAPPPT